MTATGAALGTDVVTVAPGTGSGAFADKTVGNSRPVTVSGYTLTGADATNYVAVQPAALVASITKANLAVTGLGVLSRAYDSTTTASLTGTAGVTALGADVVTVSGTGVGLFSDKNVGKDKAVSVSGYTLGGADLGNYNLVEPAGLTASISKANLQVTGVTASGKTYNATTLAVLSGTAAVARLGSDDVNLAVIGTGQFADKNVGTSKTINVTGYVLGGQDASNYNIVQPTAPSASITAANLAIGGITAVDKTYDTTTRASLAGTAVVAAFGSDVVSVLPNSGIGTFDNKTAKINKVVTASGYSLVGADKDNYAVVQPTALVASISTANLGVSGLTASNKIYDGTSLASLGGTAQVSALTGDVVTVAGTGTGLFVDKNVGQGKTINVSGYTLSGADAGNYNVAQAVGLTADIGKATLAITGLSVTGRVYNGTAVATLNGSASVVRLGVDDVNVAVNGTAVFSDKNFGDSKTVTATGFTLGGVDAGNYQAIQPTGLSASISKADLAITGVGAASKTYDTGVVAKLTGVATVAGLGTDSVGVALNSGSGVFSDKNVGVDRAVSVSGYVLSGVDAPNYNALQPTSVIATISKANLAINGITANDRVYDATTRATVRGTAAVTGLGTDVVSVQTGVIDAEFANKIAEPGKAVTVTGYTLAGADAKNYLAVQPTGLTASISKANLTIAGMSANNKVYNANTVAVLNGSAVVVPLGVDNVSVAVTGSGAFADKNVGFGRTVTATGFVLGGADAANYLVVQPTGLAATISQANLAITGVAAVNRIYDTTTAASLNGSPVVAPIYGDIVGVMVGSGTATFGDKKAGYGKAVSVTGYSLSGADANNYAAQQPVGLTATISQASLAITGLSTSTKTYDATTAVPLNGTATVLAIGADQVQVAGAAVGTTADKSVYQNKAVTVSGLTLAGNDAANYLPVQPLGLIVSVTQANLTVNGVGANSKVYDAGTGATVTGTATVAALGSDSVSVTGVGTGVFSDKNVDHDKAVTVTGYGLAGGDASNYRVVQPASVTASISKANLAVTGVGVNNKVYDTTTVAYLNGTAAVAQLSGDAVSVTGTGVGMFSDKTAGSNKAVTVSGYTLSGNDAHNYNAVQPTALIATINQASLSINGISASDKGYDSARSAMLNGTAAVIALSGDSVSVTGTGAGLFNDKTANSGKPVSVTGYSLGGADAANYSAVQPVGVTASINKANLSITGISALSRVYDTTTLAILSGTAAVAQLGSDNVSVTGTGAGAFADKIALSNKAVSVTGYTLGGVDAANYIAVQPVGVTATISPASLAVSGITASNKVYDGGTVASLNGTPQVTAQVGDSVTAAGTGTGMFGSKIAAVDKLVSINGYTLTGIDARNYVVIQPTNVIATVNQANLTISGIGASDKVYDGTRNASLTGAATVSALGSDNVIVGGTGTGVFSDKSAYMSKAVSISGYTLGGIDANNYVAVQPVGVTAAISQANLSVTGITANDKVYDSGTLAGLNGTPHVTPLGADSVNVTGAGAGAFGNKLAGPGKQVNVTGYGLAGADAKNYQVVQPTGVTASINQASLAITGISASNKVYDSTRTASLNGSAGVTPLNADNVIVSGFGVGVFADKKAGPSKTVSVSGYTLNGNDAANYFVVQPIGVQASISLASLPVSGISALSKVYDTTTVASLSGSATIAALGGDDVSVSGVGVGTFADRLAGQSKAVNVSGYTLSGGDLDNYRIVQPASLMANISQASVTVVGVNANSKVYDSTNTATLNGSPSVAALGADNISVSGNGSALFSNRNVGGGISVGVTGYSLTGGDMGNYRIVQPTGLSASITPAPLAITASSAAKVNGATQIFAGTEFTSSGAVGGEIPGPVTLTSAGAPTAAVAGAYPVTPSAVQSGGNFTSTNYTTTYVNGTLTVSAASAAPAPAPTPAPSPAMPSPTPPKSGYQSIPRSPLPAGMARLSSVSYAPAANLASMVNTSVTSLVGISSPAALMAQAATALTPATRDAQDRNARKARAVQGAEGGQAAAR